MAFPPIIRASAIAFGFVFIHPFENGNGRIHRFLIHDFLSRDNFLPTGMIIPVSAHMVNNLKLYDHYIYIIICYNLMYYLNLCINICFYAKILPSAIIDKYRINHL
jgi:Fic family protein